MDNSFDKAVIRIGTITVLMAIVANFIPVLYLWLVYGEIPPVSTLAIIWTMMLAAFGATTKTTLPLCETAPTDSIRC